MGQGDIADILKTNYPNWMSYHDILVSIDLSRGAVLRSLRCLSKHNDVEVKTENVPNSQQKWVTYYRIKNEIKTD